LRIILGGRRALPADERRALVKDSAHVAPSSGERQGEFLLDTQVVRTFVAGVHPAIAGASAPAEACEAIRPSFAELLADPDWLPAEYRAPAEESGMGGGIGQWLLYRAADGSLSLFSLVVPSGSYYVNVFSALSCTRAKALFAQFAAAGAVPPDWVVEPETGVFLLGRDGFQIEPA
jgi:hypothetical protein